jgi:hypothetical protein
VKVPGDACVAQALEEWSNQMGQVVDIWLQGGDPLCTDELWP